MTEVMGIPSKYSLETHGLFNLNRIYWNLSFSSLVEQVIQRREGNLANMGAVVVSTGKYTGRSPKDKYIVKYTDQAEDIIWWGKINQMMPPEIFESIHSRMLAYCQGRDVFVQDLFVGDHPAYQKSIRLISTKAWSALFAKDLFIRPTINQLSDLKPEFTIIHEPEFNSIPDLDHTNSEVVIILNFEKKIVLIGGTGYAGEIKKAIFTVMNYLLPQQGVLSMHCSANVGRMNDTALFFGLSGTGKTTLASDPERGIIGDDEHGWCDEGIFNLEGGCYAKTIHLQQDLEPMIWEATQGFGAVLENVTLNPHTGVPDFDDDQYTENTRAAYPIQYLGRHYHEGIGKHPKYIFFLTADAFGVLPPLARLSAEQAIYYFLSGYTSKLAGTEKGITEPKATFSACFGAPFIPLHPEYYAHLLEEKIERHQAKIWLVNTGWTGGSYGIGRRISLPFTRAMVKAVLQGELDQVQTWKEPFFGLSIPIRCPGIPNYLLDPRKSWSDPAEYDQTAIKLQHEFEINFNHLSQETD